MATWICPFCRAQMTVKDSLLGQTKPCIKCGQESVVEDVDAVLWKRADTPPEAVPQLIPKEAAIVVKDLREGVGTGPKIFLVLAAVGNIAFGIMAFKNFGLVGFFGLFSVMLMWPLYTMAADTREILNRMKKDGERQE